MFKRTVVAMVLAMAGLACAHWAAAEDGVAANHLKGKFGAFGNVGFSTYSMSGINDGIDAEKFGLELVGYSVDATTINGGMNFNGGVQYAFLDKLAVGLEGGYLTANGKLSWKGSITGWDHADATEEWNLPATEFGIFAKGMLPVGNRLLLNAKLGLDLVSMMGSYKYTDREDGTSMDTTFTGSTIGFKATAGAEFFLLDFMSLGLDLGLRSAKISDVKNQDGETVANTSVDYSGFLFQGGLRFYF